MNLSFSTKGWHKTDFNEFCDIAEDLGFKGIELHNIHNRLFTDKDGAFHEYAAMATRRKLFERKLTLACIDTICDISDEKNTDATMDEVKACLEIAGNLQIPYIRVRAEAEKKTDENFDFITKMLEEIVPLAEAKNVVVLIEIGVFTHKHLYKWLAVLICSLLLDALVLIDISPVSLILFIFQIYRQVILI